MKQVNGKIDTKVFDKIFKKVNHQAIFEVNAICYNRF